MLKKRGLKLEFPNEWFQLIFRISFLILNFSKNIDFCHSRYYYSFFLSLNFSVFEAFEKFRLNDSLSRLIFKSNIYPVKCRQISKF